MFVIKERLYAHSVYFSVRPHGVPRNFSGGDLYIYITLASKKINNIQGDYTRYQDLEQGIFKFFEASLLAYLLSMIKPVFTKSLATLTRVTD
jgi:hypothetical protein